jgi:transposase InsO family protein
MAADALSRLLSENENGDENRVSYEAEHYIRFVAVNCTPAAMNIKEIEAMSDEDDELKTLRSAIDTGHFESCKQYSPVAAELCKIGQVVLRGTRIILPRKLRPKAIALAHEGHLGISGTKSMLRTKVWWPGIDKEVEKFCRTCHGCQLVSKPDPAEPLRTTPLPQGPWQDIATDLLGPLPSGESILVIIDYYSRFYEVKVMRSTTTDKVIDALDELVIDRYGIPKTIRSDNGPQFISNEFRQWCEEHDIRHVKTTPKHAAANGEVERQNASLMKRIRIAHAQSQDWKRELRKYIRAYRNTIHPTTGKTPAELVFSFKPRGKIPSIQLEEVVRDEIEVRDKDNEMKAKAKQYFDQNQGAKHSNVNMGDQVLMRQEKKSKLSTPFAPEPFTVVEKKGNSVVIENSGGAQYARNTTDVKKFYPTPSVADSQPDEAQAATATSTTVDLPSTVCKPTADANQSVAARPRRTVKQPVKLKDYVT